MIETRRLKNVVIFLQSILSFVLSRKIIKIDVPVDKIIQNSRKTFVKELIV